MRVTIFAILVAVASQVSAGYYMERQTSLG